MTWGSEDNCQTSSGCRSVSGSQSFISCLKADDDDNEDDVDKDDDDEDKDDVDKDDEDDDEDDDDNEDDDDEDKDGNLCCKEHWSVRGKASWGKGQGLGGSPEMSIELLLGLLVKLLLGLLVKFYWEY